MIRFIKKKLYVEGYAFITIPKYETSFLFYILKQTIKLSRVQYFVIMEFCIIRYTWL